MCPPRSFLSLLLLLVSKLASADLQFTSPTSSSSFIGGTTVTVSWREDGSTSPKLSQYDRYTLELCTGSNIQITPLYTFVTGARLGRADSVQVVVPASIGESAGGAKINQKPHRHLRRESGEMGPDIPYPLQTGPVRYAPMQRQPGRSITASPTPAGEGGKDGWGFTSSKVETYFQRGAAPRAEVTMTVTKEWDYVVTSLENTASPAPLPREEFQKFAKRGGSKCVVP
ncbi:hypothetical protein BGX38DRAFT_1154048 [Terfezia claveryi]|nr:hypothetical protein BGX38DRAFT_1154048 [Terfezia claveryi]